MSPVMLEDRAVHEPVLGPYEIEEKRRWSTLFRLAGWSALISALLIPVILVVYASNPFPETVFGWFGLLQDHPFVGLVDLDLFLLVDNALLVAIALAVYVALRRTDPSLVLIGLGLWFLSIVMFIVVNPAFQMLSLSDSYASATTKAQRLATLGAGRAALATWEGSAFHVGYIAGSVAGILIAFVMIRSGMFGKAVAYTMIGGNALAFGLYIPEVGIAISAFSGLLIGVWYVLIIPKLFRLARS
jgi:hypothetical protein